MDFKNDFNTWLEENHYYTINRFIDHDQGVDIYIASFEELPFSFQWGVIVDFFNEKGIDIGVSISRKKKGIHYSYFITFENDFRMSIPLKTINESRKAAYEKAKEIYEQLNPKQ